MIATVGIRTLLADGYPHLIKDVCATLEIHPKNLHSAIKNMRDHGYPIRTFGWRESATLQMVDKESYVRRLVGRGSSQRLKAVLLDKQWHAIEELCAAVSCTPKQLASLCCVIRRKYQLDIECRKGGYVVVQTDVAYKDVRRLPPRPPHTSNRELRHLEVLAAALGIAVDELRQRGRQSDLERLREVA